MEPDESKISDDIKTSLKSVIDHFQKEDQAVRERQIRLWRSLKLYWDGFQKIWYSEVAHDWRIWDEVRLDNDQSFYDKPINVFKAYLESIIAALSVTTPSIYCSPDDADNPLDLSTAKAGNKIFELISKHNNISMLWLHALFIYVTEGMTAAYHYSHEDEKYGTYDEKNFKDEEQERFICPSCMEELDDLPAPPIEDVLLGVPPQIACPYCGGQLDPMMQPIKVMETKLVGITKKAKSRQCIEVYGGLYVKVPNYARTQKDCPYLFYSYETHYVNVLAKYDWLTENQAKSISTGGGAYEPYDRWGRLSTQYRGEYPVNNVTVRNCWLRPSSFYVLPKDERERLTKKYPEGVKVILVNDTLCEAVEEKLDDRWTLSYNPLADYIHHDPLGLLLTSIQDITNELTSLTLQTIEHGIGQTFIDDSVIDFEAYKQTEATPGMIFPAHAKTGRSLSESFFEIKTATLSSEVGPFAANIQSMGQLVSGALPSLFGGAQENSSKTAAQYSMSRAQALQRLQNVWKFLSVWWKEVFGKVIPAYIENIAEDERFVEKDESGNFVNVLIRKAELQGKIGSVELESSDELPMTWSQKKEAIMQFLQAANPVIMEALVSPENIPFLAEALGLSDFVIPGEADRNKQYEEIQLLLNSGPIDGMFPSIEPEQFIDNDLVHITIIRGWAVSDAGRLAKIENPLGYQNVLLHGKMHMENQLMSSGPEAAPGESGKPENDKVMAGAKSEVSNGE